MTAYVRRISDWSSDVCSSDLGKLEIHIVGRGFHLRTELGLYIGRLAREEGFRIVDQLGIIGLADPADARRRAALDLVEQARAVARLEEAVGDRKSTRLNSSH